MHHTSRVTIGCPTQPVPVVEVLMNEGYDEYVRQLEEKRRFTEQMREYWMARDILTLLGYTSWEKFEGVIRRAMEATESAGQPVTGNFLRTVKVQAATGPKPADYFLSRYACYLLAMNAESSKVEVGYAQTYFAIKTRQMEIAEQRALVAERVEMRDRLRDANKDLARAAKAAGVVRFPIFHNEGYRGLYGGLGLREIKARKMLALKDDLIDRMGRNELAANAFRATLADERIRKGGIAGEENAFKEHNRVGREVRLTIRRVEGTMPEDMPLEPSLKKLSAAEKKAIKGKPKAITDPDTPPAP